MVSLWGSISPSSQALSNNIGAVMTVALIERMRIFLMYIKELIIISVRILRDTNLLLPSSEIWNPTI